MAIREGRWDCVYCGRACRGRDESCAGLDGHGGCGAARPNNVRFYLPGDARPIDDPRLLADATSGQDWYCDHCGSANPNVRQGRRIGNCFKCG